MPSRSTILTLGLIALGFATSATADTITQTVDNIDWNAAMWGTPAAVPTAGNDYVSATGGTDRFRISADGSSSTFAGDSITAVAGTRALMKTTDGNTSTVNGDFILDGGRLSHAPNSGSHSATLDISQLVVMSTGGWIDVAASSATFTIDGTLTGSGNLLIDYEGGSEAGSRTVSFTGISGYTGAITVNEGMGIEFGGDYTFTNTLTLNTTSSLNVNSGQTLTFDDGALVDAANGAVAPGTYSGATLDALGANYVNNGGTLVVTGTAVDTDGDGLPDSYENKIIDFDPADGVTDFTHVAGPSDLPAFTDFDGDGATDAEEYANLTDPTDDDSDDDGLLDGVETNTGVFVDENNTGSNPLKTDSDSDGFDDGTEVRYGFDPNLVGGANTPGDAVAIVNGGFEAPAVAVSGEGIAVSGGTVPGWSAVGNDFWVTDALPPGSDDPSTPSEGDQFATANRLAPNPDVPSSSLNGGDAAAMSMRQDIDVSALAAEIDAEARSLLVDFDWFGADGSDFGIVTVRFLDASDQDLGRHSVFRSSGTSGEWHAARLSANPPAGTRVVRVTLEAIAEGGGTVRNIAFDNLRARLVHFDKDEDNMADDWETAHGLNPDDPDDADGHADPDILNNLDEFRFGTDPTRADTDGDGIDDALEIANGSDPLDPAVYPILPLVSVSTGFDDQGGFEITYTGLNMNWIYDLTRGIDLQSFPDVVSIVQPASGTAVFRDDSPPEERAFYRLSETGSVPLLIAGDSIVQTYTGALAEQKQGWGQRVGDFFYNVVQIDNMAVSGESTKTFMDNWTNLSAKITAGTFVLIQFGHNDSHFISRPEATTIEEYKTNLVFFVRDVKSKGGIPVLVTPPYRRSFDADGNLLSYMENNTSVGPSDLAPRAAAMIEVATAENVALVDLFARSGELIQSLGEEGSQPLFVDIAHSTPLGAKVHAKMIMEELIKQNHPLGKYINQAALDQFELPSP